MRKFSISNTPSLKARSMTRKPFYSPRVLQMLAQARKAIRARDYVQLNTLLAEGLNPNVPGADGRYLIHDAIMFDSGATAIDILAHYRANMNVQWAGYMNWTPAHIAWFSGRTDIVNKLQSLGADLTVEDDRGRSASRALSCPIARIEARRKLSVFANLVGHTRVMPAFA